ncbi:hypothetical protein EVAR_24857_1 [Eumeta japonica]|uniref:Uncharacterized protein n=1 Tax=Eumeta variegata TaxID=151549 RepID=A0A4C1YC97_EUMVA|nr:hypothetical protein EVAR_24857_1 [Eumeta japonica]
MNYLNKPAGQRARLVAAAAPTRKRNRTENMPSSQQSFGGGGHRGHVPWDGVFLTIVIELEPVLTESQLYDSSLTRRLDSSLHSLARGGNYHLTVSLVRNPLWNVARAYHTDIMHVI